MGTKEEKREYLTERILDGARLLYDLFREAKNGYDPIKLANELRSQYELTPNQKKVLKGVVSRLSKSKKKIAGLEKKFGINEHREFNDPAGLYQYIYGEKPNGELKAKSFSFAIGFYVPKDFLDEDLLGCAQPLFLGLNSSAINRLEIEGDVFARGLTFLVNEEEHLAGDYDVLASILGSELIKTKGCTEKHELKHIIDGLVGCDHQFLKEFSARVYGGGTGEDFRFGFELDSEEIKEKINLVKKRIIKFKDFKAPDKYIKKEEEVLKEKEKLLRSLDGVADISNRLIENSLDRWILSFIVSTTPAYKLSKRLKSIENYLKTKTE